MLMIGIFSFLFVTCVASAEEQNDPNFFKRIQKRPFCNAFTGCMTKKLSKPYIAESKLPQSDLGRGSADEELFFYLMNFLLRPISFRHNGSKGNIVYPRTFISYRTKFFNEIPEDKSQVS